MGCLRTQSGNTQISDGHFRVELSPEWKIWGPNGGYLAACVLRAVGTVSEHAMPVSYFGQYLRVAAFGEADIHVECLKKGRQSAAYSARMVQDGKLILQAMVWTGTGGTGLEHVTTTLPDSHKGLAEAGKRPEVGPMPFWHNLDLREVIMEGGHYGHWYRFIPTFEIEDAYLDAARSLVLIDTMQWPAAWYKHEKPTHLAPSLDLYVRFHNTAPQSEWLYSHATADIGAHGFLAGSAHVWSEDGTLLASGGSQSICVPMPS
jgi:acyl-CoA thioesterase